ncbi:MAG: hypothetical protein AAFV62_06430, partial [Pseudomonadota bacterium]
MTDAAGRAQDDTAALLLDLQNATWPATETRTLGEGAGRWQLRWSGGGGQRVNSASPLGSDTAALRAVLPEVSAFYEARGDTALFQLFSGERTEHLTRTLLDAGYALGIESVCLSARVDRLADLAITPVKGPYLIEINTPLARL